MREGSLPAVKVGGSYQVAPDAIERFLADRSKPEPPPSTTHVRDWEARATRLHRALAEGDELGARQIVERLHDGGIPVLVLCEKLLTPALRQLGADWAEGKISVAEEHRASAICERLLARIAVHPRGRPRGVCVVATPPGEEHSLPAAMAAVVLRAERWQVHHLGTQVPLEDLIGLLVTERADLVVLSVTMPDGQTTGAPIVAAAGEAGARVLVGQPGASLRRLVEEAGG